MAALKKTQAVASMRQSIEDALIKINEGEIDLVSYAGISCSNCIHKNHHVFEEPCASCSSVSKEDSRDFRTTTRHHWTPDFEAHVDSIRLFHKLFELNDLQFLLDNPPVRCINPKCSVGYLKVHNRGLCKRCHTILEHEVERDRNLARDYLLMACMSESDFEYEACIAAYDRLSTWHLFIVQGRCLPEEEDFDTPLRELGLNEYYSAVMKNKGENPTRRQLYWRGLNKEQVEKLSHLVTLKE